MTIFDLFSKRQKRLRGEVPDVYTYDSIPNRLRVQIVHIWRDSIGNENEYYDENKGVKRGYKFIVETLCREYGVFRLTDREYGDRYGSRSYIRELFEFFLQEEDAEKTLDVIELSFRVIDRLTRKFEYRGFHRYTEIADNSISELNSRFKEHGIGYQYEDGEIMRVDSQLLHNEAVKPALRLLSGKDYDGAQQEFLSAYEHYRQGKHKEALNDALKSFESTMKAICDKRS